MQRQLLGFGFSGTSQGNRARFVLGFLVRLCCLTQSSHVKLCHFPTEKHHTAKRVSWAPFKLSILPPR